MLEEAFALNPKLIIATFYTGNDLHDSYHLVYEHKQIPELKTTDQKIIDSLQKLEGIEPLDEKIGKIMNMGQYREKEPMSARVKNLFSDYSKVYGLLRALKRTVI